MMAGVVEARLAAHCRRYLKNKYKGGVEPCVNFP